MFNDIAKMLKVSPHILVFWRPDMKLYSAYMLKAVPTSVPAGDAYMSLLPSYKGRTNMASLFKLIQEDIFDQQFIFLGSQVRVCGRCKMHQQQSMLLRQAAARLWQHRQRLVRAPSPFTPARSHPQEAILCPTVANNAVGKTWASNPDGSDVLYAVGKTNNLVASECWDDCAWNGPTYDGTAEDVHMSIEWDEFDSWITDIKNLFEYDLWVTEYDKGKCLGPGYIWLRFGHGTPDYISMHYDMKRPVYIQSTWLTNRAVMNKFPMRYGYVTDLLELVSLCKYSGRPHWGKNFAR